MHVGITNVIVCSGRVRYACVSPGSMTNSVVMKFPVGVGEGVEDVTSSRRKMVGTGVSIGRRANAAVPVIAIVDQSRL
jgi:hypothetical protein